MANENCPVCDEEIEGKGVEVTVGEKKARCCSEECAEAVRVDPQTYAPAST